MSEPRLHMATELTAGRTLTVEGDRAHYLLHVLRLRPGSRLRLFNAEAGEWQASIASVTRRRAELRLEDQLRQPQPELGPALVFAPIKRNRLDWLVEKAVELGVSRLVPVLTRRTIVRPESGARLRTIAVEASEQCGRLTVPEVAEPQPLEVWLAGRRSGEILLFADEAGGGRPVGAALARDPAMELLVGPEGGFEPEEAERLRATPGVTPVSLGPRILRAETAALYMLAAWRMVRDEGAADLER